MPSGLYDSTESVSVSNILPLISVAADSVYSFFSYDVIFEKSEGSLSLVRCIAHSLVSAIRDD